MTVLNYIKHGLFEVDEIIVALSLKLKVPINEGKIDPTEINYLTVVRASLDLRNMDFWEHIAQIKSFETMERFKELKDSMQSETLLIVVASVPGITPSTTIISGVLISLLMLMPNLS